MDFQGIVDEIATRTTAIDKFNKDYKSYISDFADFQAQLVKKGEYWIGLNYP